jgi:regulator of protease activity HflC (stomatin/prohibitin superfamily)
MEHIRDSEQDQFSKDEPLAKRRFFIGVLLAHVVAYIPEFFLPVLEVFKVEAYWYQFVLVVQIVLFINSFKNQQPDEVGGLLLFGGWLYQTNPGLVYAPPLVTVWRHDSALLQQREIPGDLPERYGGAKTIRLTTAPSARVMEPGGDTETKKETRDPLDTGRLTLEGSFVVAARLDRKPGAYRQFIERVGTFENFLQIADDLTVNRFSKEVIKRTPSQVFAEWDEIDKTSKALLIEKVGEFGFAELDVFAKGFDLPHRVNEALANRTKEHINVETKRLEGLGDKEKNILVAVGVKAMKEAEVGGTISALVRAKSELGMTPEQALFLAYQEVIAKALEKAQYTLLPQGKGGVLDSASMMAVMQEAIKAGREGGGS